ncbi:predicted protein [Naegleria gruberi]|uniref:Predicted protein n=1 Tax=Naegleria gruberi TaxID=5762 RepID=D2W0L9_NAEGR|nr:uncharacterized protein NAEGRDRAFT_74905 [Naegleria gruberi]EFC37312.1 predicted protein [Naegleria gruberi]|eukprot:XP_002670056.1 predicted protein [Naegleria gruberi strain NEG-M]
MSQLNPLPSDMIFHMMQFCDFDQMAVVMMVSCQWFGESLKFEFEKSYASIDRNNFSEICLHPSSLLITNLSISQATCSWDTLFELFSESKYLINLRSLSVHGRDETVNKIDKLFKGKTLKNLTYLDLDRVNIGDDGFKALADSPYIKNLIHLESFWGGNSYLTSKYISESENFSKLTFIDISNTQKRNYEGYIHFCKSQFLSNLKSISFSNEADDTLMDLLTHNTYLTKLERIYMDSGTFTPDGLKKYLNSENAKNITDLYLDYAELGDEGMKVIAECPNMTNLKELSIANANISNVGALYLLESKYLKNLTSLTHKSNDPFYMGRDIDEEMDALLKQSFKN